MQFQTPREFHHDSGGSYSTMDAERKGDMEGDNEGLLRPAGAKIYTDSDGESRIRCSGSCWVIRSDLP